MNRIIVLFAFQLLNHLIVGPVIPVTPKLKQLILDIHNDYRRSEGSSNMQELVWNDRLSRIAGDWAKKCLFEHQIIGYGENLAFITDKKEYEIQIRTVMEKMYLDEKQQYTYNDQNRCGVSCHYTQIVWAETKMVGCAMHLCEPLRSRYGTPYENAWYFSCFYDPRANFCARPCVPFKRGRACSECDDPRHVCKNRLCAERPGSINPNVRNTRSANQTNLCFDNDVCPDRIV